MPLFAFGSNGSGQLGIGHVEDVSVPTKCLFDGPEPTFSSSDGTDPKRQRVVRIAAGGNHTLLLCSDGTVYSAGCNEDGRCGGRNARNGDEDDTRTRFSRVVIQGDDGVSYENFRHVAATWEATVLVADSQDHQNTDAVFVLGSGGKGELGLREGCTRALFPMRIPEFPPSGTRVMSLASGMGHTVAVLSNGEVYGWGGARKGQLGESAKTGKISWRPVRVVDEGVSFSVTGAACGREFTVLVGDQAKGEFAVLGAADNKWDIRSGSRVLLERHVQGFRDIATSWHGVYVHRGDGGEVVAWGRNDRGQLPPKGLVGVKELAVGSEHALALVGPRKVVAFGWGEHGNCGPVTDAQGNVKERCADIPLPDGEEGDVVGVGAGCATSWVVLA